MKLDFRVAIAAAAVAGIALVAFSDMSADLRGSDAASAVAPSGDGAAALPEDHPDISGAPPGAASSGIVLVGQVQETLEGGGYSYVRLSTDDGEVWAAGPVTDLAEGETVTLVGAMDMGSFSSPTLERDFERLYFVDRFAAGDVSASLPAPGGDAAPALGDYRGRVKQAIQVARYVYLEVETGDGPIWLAAPEMEVAEGDEVRWAGGTLMRDFSSSTLERTFEEILFVGSLDVVEG